MNPHLLLVEDNPSDIELLRTAFEELGLDVEITVYRDGDAAIRGIEAIAPDGVIPSLMLLDLNLPRINGYEVLLHVRRQQRFADMPVVVLSTSSHPSDRSRCIDAGAADYLTKPPRFNELLGLARRLRDQWLMRAV